MLATWTLTAWRNFLRHKSFSIINVCGLSLGISCFLAILLYVFDELDYDKFHAKSDRIYRVSEITTYDGSSTRYETTATPLAESIVDNIHDVAQAARIFRRQATMQVIPVDSTSRAETKYREHEFYIVDPSILEIFTISILRGDVAKPLANPTDLMISRKIAVKYFGSMEAAIGMQMMYEGSLALQVSAVFEDLPDQSTERIELMTNFDNYYALETAEVRAFLKRDWLYNPVTTYVLLKPESTASRVLSQMQDLNKRFGDKRVQEHVSYELQPLTSIHLYSDFTYASDRNAIRYVYIFILIGTLILMIACINFINLSTVHALKRSKEIGIRKVVGALRRNLTYQFLFESLLLVLLSSLIAVLFVYAVLPAINLVSGKNFGGSSLLKKEIIYILIFTFLSTGLLAGLYPAIYISKFNPIAALKGMRETSSGATFITRRILVIVQFTASIALISFTIVIYNQINFMRDKPLGFQKDFMLTIPLFSDNPNAILGGGVGRDLRLKMNTFENELTNSSLIESVSLSSMLPGQGAVNALVTSEKIKETDNLFIPIVSIDYDFLETYNINIVAGRAFSKDAGTDHLQAFIANESAVKALGFREAARAIGQEINAVGKRATIIGVVKDYHFEGLQQPLRPLLLEVDVSKFAIFSLRLNQQDVPATIERIKSTWNALFPDRVFEYQFLDEQLQGSYAREERFGHIINYFSGLTIFISALGLFGLAAYVAYQKQREAGIRKILGASTWQVFHALSREFVIIMGIAVCLAIPVAYLLTNSWLNDFAFRVGIGWSPFVAAVAVTAIIVFLTTAYQTFKTASINPIITIRNE